MEQFIEMLKNKYPNIDVDSFISIFNEQIDSIKEQTVDGIAPKFPIDSHISINIAIKVATDYMINAGLIPAQETSTPQ